jgi:hypothetical protein
MLAHLTPLKNTARLKSTDTNTIIVEEFNTPLLPTDRTFREKKSTMKIQN